MSESSPYHFAKEVVQTDILKYRVTEKANPITFARFAKLLQEDEAFLDALDSVLKADNEFEGYFFETPPVTAQSFDARSFEFVLVRTGSFQRASPDESAFSEYYTQSCDVVPFWNLGKDARLVAPCPRTDTDSKTYVHLASFVRQAPSPQKHAFWKEIGKQMEIVVKQRQGSKTWLSTSGLGIYWLHMRLDSVPKYYTFLDYKKDINKL